MVPDKTYFMLNKCSLKLLLYISNTNVLIPNSPVSTAQGSLNDAKPVPLEFKNPSTRSGEQVGHALFSTGHWKT